MKRIKRYPLTVLPLLLLNFACGESHRVDSFRVGPDVDPGSLARAVAFANGCALDYPIQTLLEQTWQVEGPQPRVEREVRENIECINALDSCDGLFECIGFGPTREADCLDACIDGISTRCDVGIRRDCSRIYGGRCSSEYSWCALVDPPARACDWTMYSNECRDGRPVVCLPPGILSEPFPYVGFHCASVGLACREDDDFDGCTAEVLDPSCDSRRDNATSRFDGDTCDGNRLERCLGGGRVKFDCSVMHVDATCVESEGGAFCGFANECEPSAPEWATGQCEGTRLTVCNRGRTETIDCDALGFASCNAELGCQR